MGDIRDEAALSEHRFQIAIAQWITQAPGNGRNDEPSREMPPLEVILRLALQLLGNGIRNYGDAPLVCPLKSDPS